MIFTIDGEDAKDLDDAISIKKTKTGWQLGVHIADVSHYIKPGSHLDNEAMERGTSVYFADRVIPMLPKELSNGICSLNANEDRLAFSALLNIDKKGNLKTFEFKKSVINSKVRGIYSEVNSILMAKASEKVKKKYSLIENSLLEAYELSKILHENAQKRGNMELESTEARFKLDDNGVCVDVKKRTRGAAEEMIEQFMIMANQAAALYAKGAQIPFVFRVHEMPSPEKINILAQTMSLFGLKAYRIRQGLKVKDISDILEQIKGTDISSIVSNQVLRSMSKARYFEEPLGHFGLALEDYCHFTSPIRRYPDTAIHRILSDLVRGVSVDKIEKNYGKGAIMKMGDDHIDEIAVIPTGSIGLNAALGVGGFPRGRVIEIYGPESSGKTTLAIHAIAEAQKAGGIAAIIDAEHAFDRFYAEKLGVDVENLWISQPDSGEQALEIAEQLIRSSAVDIVVIDSVAALTPKAELEGDMGESKMGLQARLMSQALRKLTATISKTNTTCIFINQLRDKLGVMFGNPETTTGGNALKFYASVRLDIRRVSQIKDGDEVIGNQTRVKVVKNKVAPPFRKAEFDIMFGEGISRAGEIIDLGVEKGIIKKSGSWFSYDDTKLGQGRDAAKKCIQDNPELAEELEAKIMEALRPATK